MKRNHFLILILVVLLPMAACNKPTEDAGDPPQPTDTELPTIEVATEKPATETPNIFQVDPIDPSTVAYDFVAEVCSAEWSTNASQLPCPGHLEDKEGGYIEASDHTVLEGMISVEAPLLIGLPGNGYPSGLGLFGKYPPITVYPGDLFKAVIACQGDAICDLEFALDYFDAQGTYHGSAFRWFYKVGQGPLAITADLNALAGQTVELLLVLRPQEELDGQWAVWIQPHISRDPDAKPLPTVEIQPTPQADPDDKTPGVISGMVAMGSAPPYMNDPGTGNSMPVAVVFFNQDDGTYWWIHTSLTGHPYFQMTVPPGNYQVVAYGKGVGNVAYVAAGYTGQNPSCGKKLITVTVPPNGKAENIVVADWNWTCGGSAYRPDKPGGVPLPK